jgi:hypothetical protein
MEDLDLEAKKKALQKLRDLGLSKEGEYPEEDELLKTPTDKLNDALQGTQRKKMLKGLFPTDPD